MTEPQSTGEHKFNPRIGALLWGIGGAVLGAISAAALVATHMTAVINFLQFLFPQLGPFDASITIASPSVVGRPRLSQKAFDGGRSEPAVELKIEYVEIVTGRSQLKHCYSELQLERTRYPASSTPVQRPSNFHELIDEVFFLPQKHYGGQATLWRRCTGRVAGPIALDLPALQSPTIPTQDERLTRLVCIGEHQRVCGPNTVWLSCGSSASNWAQKTFPNACRNVREDRLSSVGGNRCGYSVVQVICTQ